MRIFTVIVALFFILMVALIVFYGNLNTMLWVYDQKQPFLNPVFATLTRLGEAPILILTGLLFLFIHRPMAVAVAVSGILTSIFAGGLKLIFAHPRPRTLMDIEGHLCNVDYMAGLKIYTGYNSFPSGHTMAAFALYTLLALWQQHRPGWVLFWALLACGVGFSRIYLLNHFPSDVLFGAVLGCCIGLTAFKSMHWYNEFLQQKNKSNA